jgi:Heterokaryon incompatibility protein (HET)
MLTDKKPWMPTRLVDVNSSDKDEDNVRIIETQGELQEGVLDYLTLSHVWGRTKAMKLTRSNYDHCKSGIKIMELPDCFRDAVLITRRLGVRYIWIDSLW